MNGSTDGEMKPWTRGVHPDTHGAIAIRRQIANKCRIPSLLTLLIAVSMGNPGAEP